ncbi:MAG: YcfL family protein [Phycisphaeraceae bacterium]|nr:MAG: YcfL family protein [Phycisphaeraceae bacterium]
MKPQRRIVLGFLTLAAAGLLAACQGPHSVNTVGPAERRALPQRVEDERLITDPLFSKQVYVTGLIEGATDSGLRIIEAEVQNATRIHQAFRYRFSWYGEDGREVRGPTTAWLHESIPPGSLRRLTGIAPNHNAHDFRLELYADQ